MSDFNSELLAAVRQEHPETKDVPDGELLSALAKEHPEIFPAGNLAYKQETARQTFEANKPVPTAGTGLANLGDSLKEGISSIPGGIVDLYKAGLSGNPSALVDAGKGMVHGAVDPPIEYVKALLRGDPDAAASQAGKVITNTLPAVEGVGSLAKGLGTPSAEFIKQGITKHITAPAINESLNIPNGIRGPNIDPGMQLIKDKFTGTAGGLKNYLETKMEQLGPQIEEKLKAANQSGKTTMNLRSIIDDEMAKAQKNVQYGADAQFQGKVGNISDAIDAYEKAKGVDLRYATPLEAQQFKSWLSDSIRWKDQVGAAPHEEGINDALKGISTRTNGVLTHVAPEARDLLNQWGNYEVGAKALNRVMENDRFRMMKLKDLYLSQAPTTTAGRFMRPTNVEMPEMPAGTRDLDAINLDTPAAPRGYSDILSSSGRPIVTPGGGNTLGHLGTPAPEPTSPAPLVAHQGSAPIVTSGGPLAGHLATEVPETGLVHPSGPGPITPGPGTTLGHLGTSLPPEIAALDQLLNGGPSAGVRNYNPSIAGGFVVHLN